MGRKKTRNYKKKRQTKKRRMKGGADEDPKEEQTQEEQTQEEQTQEEQTKQQNEKAGKDSKSDMEEIAKKIAENEIIKEEMNKINKSVSESDKVRSRITNERSTINQNVDVKDVKFEDAAVQLRFYEDEFDKKLEELNEIKRLLEQARKEYNDSKREYQYSQIDKLKYPK